MVTWKSRKKLLLVCKEEEMERENECFKNTLQAFA
jgi:hypothetical protein